MFVGVIVIVAQFSFKANHKYLLPMHIKIFRMTFFLFSTVGSVALVKLLVVIVRCRCVYVLVERNL